MKRLLFIAVLVFIGLSACLPAGKVNAQECLGAGFCSNITNEHKYPTTTFTTTSSTWTVVSAYMNADNYTYFKVTSGNIYEWTYCEAYGGVSTGWDAQLTLSDTTTTTFYCFSDNVCGTNSNAPYIGWTATFTGVVKLLTSQSSCTYNSGSPYNTLVWRMANGGTSTQILGLDVSHYQGTINWAQVKASPKVFAWAKATEGTTFTDPDYVTNTVNGTNAGMAMGAYHFARPENNTAAAEASYFLSVAGPYITACSLPPALDVENPPSGPSLQSSFTSAALTQWIHDWLTAVKTQTGITPVVYIGASNAAYLQSSINTYPLWMSDPDGSSTAPPASLGVWADWAFKQYSWTGTVSGISGSGSLDLDVFNGDSIAFNNLIGCPAVGITERFSGNNLIIYPNPANDNITIDFSQKATIEILDIQARLIKTITASEGKTNVDISAFSSGVYIVEVKTEKCVAVRKFVKK
ncbi:MAG: GH25 family lysozyme [Bacteroidales bacterium]|jgi:GH25 family lysozyme M1 (1,4-beta-N-acetylmuramidase)